MANSLKFELVVDDKGSLKVKKFGKVVDEVSIKGGTFGKKFGTAATAVGSFAANVVKAGVGLASMGLALAGISAGNVIRNFQNFQTALVDMAKVTDESLGSIRDKIFELDASLGSSTELVQTYYQAISAGVTDPVKAMELVVTASKFAKTAHIENSEAVKALTKVMFSYKDSIKDAAAAADLLQTIEKQGQTSVAELISEVGGLSAVFAAAGISADEMGSALAAVTAVTGSTSEAATRLISLSNSLTKASSESSQEIWGTNSAMEAIKNNGFADTLQRLKDHFGEDTQALQKFLGSTEAYQAFLGVMNSDQQKFNENMAAFAEKTGALDKQWSLFTTTVENARNVLSNTINNLMTEIGENFEPEIRGAFEAITKAISDNKQGIMDWVQVVVDGVRQNHQEWLTLGKAIIDFGEGAARALNVVITVFNAVGGTIGVLAAKAVEFAEGAAAKFIEAWRSMAEAGSNAADKIKGAFDAVFDAGKRAAEAIKDLFSGSGGKDMEVNIEFTGTGSEKKPITEKISEITGRLNEYADHANSLEPTVTTHFRGDGGDGGGGFFDETNKVRDTIQNMTDYMAGQKFESHINFVADGRPLHIRLEQYLDQLRGLSEEAKIKVIAEFDTNKALKAMLNTMEHYEHGIRTTSNQYMKLVSHEMAKMWRGRAISYATELANSIIENLKSQGFGTGAGDRGGSSTRSFATGTGPQGLPSDGMFGGHQGEIVLNQQQSAVVRQGGTAMVGGGGVTNNNGGNISMHIPITINGGGGQAGKDAVDGFIMELRRRGIQVPGMTTGGGTLRGALA